MQKDRFQVGGKGDTSRQPGQEVGEWKERGSHKDIRVLPPVVTLTSLPLQEVYPCEVGVT